MAVDTIYVNDGKSATAYRTISETAEILDLPAHVLRFWETKFPNIKPMTRAGGRRFYRPEDIAALRAIQIYLHEDGLSIQETKAALKELGHRNVVERGFEFIQFEDAETTPQTRANAEKAQQDARTSELTNALQNAQNSAPQDAETSNDINNLLSDDVNSSKNASETTQAASVLAAALSSPKPDTSAQTSSSPVESAVAAKAAAPTAKNIAMNREVFTGTTRLRLLAIDAELERMQNRVSHWLEDSAKFA